MEAITVIRARQLYTISSDEELYSVNEDTPAPSGTTETEDEEWYNTCISNEEVSASLEKMKRRKAAGPYQIAIDILKDQPILTPLLPTLSTAAAF